MWHVKTARVMRTWKLPEKIIDSVAWNPSKDVSLIAVCNEEFVWILQPNLASSEIKKKTAEVIRSSEESYKIDAAASEKKE